MATAAALVAVAWVAAVWAAEAQVEVVLAAGAWAAVVTAVRPILLTQLTQISHRSLQVLRLQLV